MPTREGALPVWFSGTDEPFYHEGTAVTGGLDVSKLPEGVYCFYLTSAVTGDYPLARSEMVEVLHYPEVQLVAWDRDAQNGFEGAGDDGDVVLDTGTYYDYLGTTVDVQRTYLDLYINVDDFDDDAQILIYYDTSSSLDTTNVETTGSSPDLLVSSLGTATLLADTLSEADEDESGYLKWRLDIEDDAYAPYIDADVYYIYVVANDGKHQSVLVSKGSTPASTDYVEIKHSPGMKIDSLADFDLGTDIDYDADVTIDVNQT
ncbi:hypothetical protein ACFL1R_12470 [Candidatus Latescibacterota bacterium]